ncbi:hypothetical protein BC941DRAFT_412999 [Chlamydoabsidia padenii]|nr:hypothetical protein BC941DRAFT_412999 [Chlamydoabsidia padenii]
MEYHEIRTFISQEKLRALNTNDGYHSSDDSSDSSNDMPLFRHLKTVQQQQHEEEQWHESSYHPYDSVLTTKKRTSLFKTQYRQAKLGKRLDAIWKQQPLDIMTPNEDLSPDSNVISPITLLEHIIGKIHTLKCLIEIKIQSVEDHERDIKFYLDRLDQLKQDTKYLNRKVAGAYYRMEEQLDPVQDQIQRTVTSLKQLHQTHLTLVRMALMDRNRSKISLESTQARVSSAQDQLDWWDTITFWTWPLFVIALVCVFVWGMIALAGWTVTLITMALMFGLVYDTS